MSCFSEIRERAFFLLKIFIYIIFFILFYIGFIQIFRYEHFKERSLLNYKRKRKIVSRRGSIVDRNDEIIVDTAPVIKVFWNKRPNKITTEDKELIRFLNEKIELDVTEESLFEKNLDKKILLADDLEFEKLAMLLENFSDSERISIEVDKKRNYKNDKLACHLIGYINTLENNGISGIEKICNFDLEGNSGYEELIVDSVGRVIESKVLEKPKEGNSIKLTIDMNLQRILEKSMEDEKTGSAIVINPENGDILASVSVPRFDPNIFLSKIKKDEWTELIENKAFINRGFQALYAPGSIFKIISAIAMLEEKLIDENTTWYCHGCFDFKNREYACVNKSGHGRINIVEALAHSCNIPFFSSSANKLTIDNIYKYACKYELGESTGSLLNEEIGLVANKKWKEKYLNEKWYLGETLSVSIGQGATKITPIQIAKMFGAVMTGNIIKPRIIYNESVKKKPIFVRKETLNIVREGLHLATIDGSSRSLKRYKDWKIYAKTGTSQVCSLKLNREADQNYKKYKHHGLIVCYLEHKYKNIDPIIIVIVVENCGSSSFATAVLREFISCYEKEINNKLIF